MKLAFDIASENLHQRDGLSKLDKAFVAQLERADPKLCARFAAAKLDGDVLEDGDRQKLIAELIPHAKNFVDQLFSTCTEEEKNDIWRHALVPLYACRNRFCTDPKILGAGLLHPIHLLAHAVKTHVLLHA